MIHTIRIPEEHLGKVWLALVNAGPLSRISEEPIYLVDDRQLRMLRKTKLPFELLSPSNGRTSDQTRVGTTYTVLSATTMGAPFQATISLKSNAS